MFCSIIKFYDTVSYDSSLEGEYDSTGNDWRQDEFSRDKMDDLIKQFVYLYSQNNWETSIADFEMSGDLLYASDGDQDYATGNINYDRLGLLFGDDVTWAERRAVRAAIAEAIENQ